jgi:hypothetical protein
MVSKGIVPNSLENEAIRGSCSKRTFSMGESDSVSLMDYQTSVFGKINKQGKSHF